MGQDWQRIPHHSKRMQLPASYMLTMFQDAREYDVLRLQVAQKDPGWETLQEV